MLCHDWKTRRCFVIAVALVLTTFFPLWPTPSVGASTGASRQAMENPSVDSTEEWQQMPLSVGKGEKFTVFYVSGSWTVDVRNFPRVGPDGYEPAIDREIHQPCKFVPGQPFGKLLGRAGENGTEFPVGAGGTLTAPSSGTLFLRINDADRCLGDNEGSITVAMAGDDDDVRHPLSRQNFDDYCKDQGFAAGVVTTGNDAYSVRCKNSDGSLQGFDNPEEFHNFVTEVCQSAYADISVMDRLTTVNGTYGAWECMNRASYAGVPDLQGWCGSRGLNLFHRADVRYAAYGWTCVNADRTHSEGISMALVCKSQFGQDALDRVSNVRAKTVGDAWDCRYVR
ncbi:hypothetical protein GCM10010294_60690 [Streptomyces griseoloalbus]|uniref:hypothetical protein n=1 Tax=Streptomyces griseoloalbus TaxID=67303 RepID=UPI0018770EF8|nr:hypothetical protein GCM10010294_60690 [Streptomyces griseoloalbus]